MSAATHTLLFTQCLQHDFVAPIGAQDPLPNKLHVGHHESERLMGVDPGRGPVAQLMAWARAQDAADLTVLHIRDWHDPEDPAQHDHLETYGPHCLRGTAGAELVLGVGEDVDTRQNERFVNATGLNDFVGTGLDRELERVRDEAGGASLRVGVVGVWTEAKVSFLLYDLKTRFGIDALGTCSALTASASRSQHFNALEQLRRLLGVRVFDSVGAFSHWLLPEGQVLESEDLLQGFAPRIEGATLDPGERDLVAYLFRDASEVVLTPLSGGFSGAKVFAAASRDPVGHQLAPSVVKLGTRELVGKERVAFERVEAILGNDAPSVLGFVDLGEHAALKYAYAAMGSDAAVTSFKSLYESGASAGHVARVLDAVFVGILGRFYDAAQYERLPLLEHYGFKAHHAEPVRKNALGLGFDDLAEELASFYADELEALREAEHEHHFVSYVHGDLNGANILVDKRENVWLIDFFHTARRHVVQDLIKLENDLLYIFTPLGSDAERDEAVALSERLAAVEDLAAPLPDFPFQGEALQRAWTTLRVLRGHVARVVKQDRDPLQLAIARLRYSAHTLAFEESSPRQRGWALHAAVGQARHIVRAKERNRRLRVDWITTREAVGALGLTICPGRRDRDRDLDADLDVVIEEGATTLVSLLTHAELAWAGVPDLPQAAQGRLEHCHLPIRDQSVPTRAEADGLVAFIVARLEAGEKVVLHCLGGLGRAGTVAACALVRLGHAPDTAMTAVREVRGPRAIENATQEGFVRAFE